MILLDTHIWVWWVAEDTRLSSLQSNAITAHQSEGLGVSIISCWEVVKKVQLGKLRLDRAVEDWLDAALRYPGVRLVSLTPRIVVESARLPGEFHRDPADQIIVATARVLGCPYLTSDGRLRAYPHVQILG